MVSTGIGDVPGSLFTSVIGTRRISTPATRTSTTPTLTQSEVWLLSGGNRAAWATRGSGATATSTSGGFTSGGLGFTSGGFGLSSGGFGLSSGGLGLSWIGLGSSTGSGFGLTIGGRGRSIGGLGLSSGGLGFTSGGFWTVSGVSSFGGVWFSLQAAKAITIPMGTTT